VEVEEEKNAQKTEEEALLKKEGQELNLTIFPFNHN
jgi:hypothetical protein